MGASGAMFRNTAREVFRAAWLRGHMVFHIQIFQITDLLHRVRLQIQFGGLLLFLRVPRFRGNPQ